MTDSTRTAITAYLDALNAHDADRAAACVASGFVNEHTAAGAVSLVGRAAYREALDGFLADFEQLAYTPEAIIADGRRCAVPYRMTALVRSAGGRRIEVRGVFVFTVDGAGLLERRVDYWDSGEVARQLG
ncbi:MAG: nuclear transport factor 2 family protein [Jatrophihabitantaceae bacterium]